MSNMEYYQVGADDQLYYGGSQPVAPPPPPPQQTYTPPPSAPASAPPPSNSQWSNPGTINWTDPPAASTAPPPAAQRPQINTLTGSQQSAKATIEAMLGTYGLSALADRAWNLYLSGQPIERVMFDLRQTPEYKARFPGMDALSQKGRAISEQEYIDIEKGYVAAFRQAGLPEGFYDGADDFASYISGEVSPAEMNERLQVYRTAAYNTPPEVRAELARLYNVDIGGVTAFIMDPTRALPVLQNQFAAAQSSAAAVRSGYGALTQNEAEGLAGYGVTFDQATQGFGQLSDSAELFNPLIGDQGEDAISRDEQLSGTFSGNAAARRKMEQRARKRQAQFGGGIGGYDYGVGGDT